MSDELAVKEYYPIWKKYKPVLLKLMKDATEGEPQTYQLSKHEFTDANTRKTATYTFKIASENSRLLKTSKSSIVAADLIAVLKQSGTAIELLDSYNYNFAMDNQFNLTVNAEAHEVAAESTEEEAS